jgi:Prophage CP4-57 regulatory protein (AlpA).
MNFDQSTPEVFGVKKLAEILGVGLNTAYDLCNRQDFPTIRLGKRQIRITREGLQQWLKNQTLH